MVLSPPGSTIASSPLEICWCANQRCSRAELLEALPVDVERPLQGEDADRAAGAGGDGVTNPVRHTAG